MLGSEGVAGIEGVCGRDGVLGIECTECGREPEGPRYGDAECREDGVEGVLRWRDAWDCEATRDSEGVGSRVLRYRCNGTRNAVVRAMK